MTPPPTFSEAPILDQRPVLIVGTILAVIQGAAAFLVSWGGGADVRLAAAAGLGIIASGVGAAFGVQAKVYSPATAEQIMAADTFIAEQGEP